MLWVLAAAALIQQGSANPPRAGAAPAAAVQISEAALVDSLEAAELRFFSEWHRRWGASEAGRHLIVGQLEGNRPGAMYRRDGNNAVIGPNPSDRQTFQVVRHVNLACHSGNDFRERSRAIASRVGWYGACPTWLLGPLETEDERNSHDGALSGEHREEVEVARRSLADTFVTASAKFPRNDWIVGQAVRLLVDARNVDRAKAIALACVATRWWCETLKGYAFAARNETVAAENAFRTALEQMPRDVRCRWTDFAVLLDSVARVEYANVPCEQRDSVNQSMWWLADPLYSVPGNARLVEHYSRQTLVALHSALDRDERYDWRPALGGDALSQMIIRYGWPSYTFWGGEAYERGINKVRPEDRIPFKRTYTTFEYTAGRAQLIPSWNAMKDPLRATVSDWTIRDPAPPEDPNKSEWWPQEHFATPIAQLPESQLAMLRRQTNVLIASAVDLDTSLARRTGGEVLNATVKSGMLLMTDRPDSIDVIARGSARAGSTLVLRGTAVPRTALLGIELAGDTARGVAPARTRFSVSPPAALATMRPDELAISEPVVLRAPSGDAALPLDADSALALMLGSTKIARGSKIGVYWESYGFQPTDSVTVAVWIERYTQQNFMRQLGIAFKVATDLNTPVATSWDEVPASARAHVFGGQVPIIGRSVVLDVSTLPAGDYWLEVAVGKRGQVPVRARRTVTIQ